MVVWWTRDRLCFIRRVVLRIFYMFSKFLLAGKVCNQLVSGVRTFWPWSEKSVFGQLKMGWSGNPSLQSFVWSWSPTWNNLEAVEHWEHQNLELFWKPHNPLFFGRVRHLFGPFSDLRVVRIMEIFWFSDSQWKTTTQNTKVCLITPSHRRATTVQRAPAWSSRNIDSQVLRRLLSATSTKLFSKSSFFRIFYSTLSAIA